MCKRGSFSWIRAGLLNEMSYAVLGECIGIWMISVSYCIEFVWVYISSDNNIVMMMMMMIVIATNNKLDWYCSWEIIYEFKMELANGATLTKME